MRITLFICLVLLFSACVPKEAADGELSAKQKIKYADQLFEEGSYYNAIDYYEEVIAEQQQNSYVLHQLAAIYFASRDYKMAERTNKRLLDMDLEKYPLTQLDYAQALKRNGKYQAAKTQFADFGKTYKGTDKATLKKLTKKEVKACEFAIKSKQHPVNARIKHLGTMVNAAYTDYAPLAMGDSLFLFSSLRSDTVFGEEQAGNPEMLSKMYQVSRRGDSFISKETMSDAINDNKDHTGNGAISPDGKRLYFTRCNQNEYDEVTCAIYVSKLVDGAWTEGKKLNGMINKSLYTSTHPTIGNYRGKVDILYFASTRPGGIGGMDIWYSIITRGGSYKEPVNCGRAINTKENEITPFYDMVGDVLYFSSDGHMNMGGFDIFSTEGSMRSWSKPENIGYPLNSPVDDMYYSLEPNGTRGYFVSNRIGSIALKSETCCDDIYQFNLLNLIKVAVKGYVYDVDDESRTPLDLSKVTLSVFDADSAKNIPLKNTETADQEMFFFKLSLNKEYKLSAKKEGYFSGKGVFKDFTSVKTFNLNSSDTIRADLYLQKMKKDKGYAIKNIYYDFDASTLRDKSETALDSLLMVLQEYPALKVEIGSHTDSRGSNSYNNTLSQKRAESVVKYLIQHEIPKVRLVARGYGETVFKEDCSIYPDCPTSAEGDCPCHQRNRRTEFKVLGEVKNLKYLEVDDEEIFE